MILPTGKLPTGKTSPTAALHGNCALNCSQTTFQKRIAIEEPRAGS